jgi:flagellar motor switch/type III secretory pathway protein FliN
VIAPFPWHGLPRVSSAQLRAAARVRRAFPGVRASAVAAQLSSLINHPVDIDVRRVHVARVELGQRGGVILFADGARAFAVEVEGELALAAASSLAGGKLPKIARGRSIDPEVMGASAGVAQWLARSTGIDAAIDAIDPPAAVLQAQLGQEALLIECVVRVGVLRSNVRVAVAVPELDRTPTMAAMDTLLRLADTPLSLPVVIGHGTARAAELSGLLEGDVVVVEHRLEGCALIAAGATSGTRAVEIEPGRVRVLAGRVELAAASLPNDNDRAMTDDTSATMQLPALEEGGRLAEDLAELPLVVRVELGSATLAAREWATLAPGDVIALDRRVGDPAFLRIGNRIVARGELVEVDGAIGVRITERTS